MVEFSYVRYKGEYLKSIEYLSHCRELAADTETYALPEWGSKGSALDPHTGSISLLIVKGRLTEPFIFDKLWLEEEGVDFTLLTDLLCSRDFLLFHNAN